MPFLRFAFLIVFCLPTIPLAAQNLPQRDPQALSILQSAVSAMGNTMSGDSVASGLVTSFVGGEELRGKIRILTRGSGKCREEADPGGVQQIRVFSKAQAADEEDSGKKPLSPLNARNEFCSFLPAVRLITTMNDPDVAFAFVGVESIEGASHYRVKVWSTLASFPGMEGLASRTETEIWIDVASNLPSRTTYSIFSSDAPGEPIPVEVRYLNFAKVGGAMVPTRVEKHVNGTPFWTVEIQQVQLNAGLTDAQFQVR